MRNVRIAYTVTLAEIPGEIDTLLDKLGARSRSLTKLIETVSFREDPKSGLETLQAIHTKLNDMEIILFDCENMGQGLANLETQLAEGNKSELPEGVCDVD